MNWKNLLRACVLQQLLLPGTASALVVEIQGVRLEPDMEGASCVDIAGVYPGVRIESDRPGQTPRICHNNGARVNSINIVNATLVATQRSTRATIRFEHEFPPGINGKIMVRSKFQGFFATGNGVGVPTGDQLQVLTFFSQGRTKDPIADPFEFTVGETVESAMFEHYAKRPYLVAGPRALKAELKVNLTAQGHKVTFPDRCLVILDSGSRFEDKLDSLEALEGAEPAPAPEGGAAPAAGGEAAPAPAEGGTTAPPAAAPAPQPERLPPLPPLPPLNALPGKPL